MSVLVPHPPPTTTDSVVPPPPARRRRRPWLSIGAVAGGVLLVAAAAAWKSVAVDALVKFPTDVNLHPQYQGTLTTFVDQATYAPLPTPTVADLQVDRTIAAVPEESSGSQVLVRETLALSVGGAQAVEQVHQYVMDRSTSTNLADQLAWAFTDTNVLDRRGAYWVALPRGSDGRQPVPMFKDEIGTTFQATGAGVTERLNGVELVGFEAAGANVRLTDAYLDAISAMVPLPRSLTFEQLKPSLVAAGVPIDETLAALVRVASPEDLATLAALTARPIALEYVDTFGGRTFVEPDTGAVVDVQGVVERVSVRPTPDALPELVNVLNRYEADPTIAAAIAALNALADQPMPVFEYRYSQTAASAAEVAAWVSDQRDQMHLAETTVPLLLAVAGGVLLVTGALGLVLHWRRPR